MKKEIEQISFLDDRFYLIGEEYFPSVTTILGVYPKGQAFNQWLKDVGNSAKIIVERAAESGSKVHNAIEKILSGIELTWDEKIYNEMEWAGICKFMEFYDRFNPDIKAIETTVYSQNHQFAGTMDLLCKIENERWLIDYKFSNAVHPSHFLQLAAYRMAIEEKNYNIDRMGILWLKAHTKTEGTGKAIQGKGWQLIEPKKDYEHLKNIFLSTYKIWMEENPNAKPKNRIYPSILTIKK